MNTPPPPPPVIPPRENCGITCAKPPPIIPWDKKRDAKYEQPFSMEC